MQNLRMNKNFYKEKQKRENKDILGSEEWGKIARTYWA